MYIRKVATVFEPDPKALPNEFRSVLTKQDIKALQEGAEYFSELAPDDAPRWLRELLDECAASFFQLEFVASNDGPWRPYFHFSWLGEPWIVLPRPGRLRSDLPNFLRSIYKVIGEFRENGFDMAGGLHAGDKLVTLDQTGMWVDPQEAISPSLAVPFLETASGSQLCYLPDGTGVWLKACRFDRVKNLEREVASYFKALLKGTRI